MDLGKHSGKTHFPKDRDCEICKRTKITRAPCRRRNVGVVLREEIFGDLLTADHKVLSEGCESRNNHRYAVVVQDLATQWIQSYPCKTKTSQETERSLQKFLESNRKPKVIYTDNSLEFGNACEDLSWNNCMSTPHRPQTSGDCWEGSSAVLLQSGLDEKWWADSMECLEACESTFGRNLPMGNSIPHNHQDHIAGKGENSLQHYNLVHKFYSYASSHEDSRSKGSSGQGMGKYGENFGVEPDQSQK